MKPGQFLKVMEIMESYGITTIRQAHAFIRYCEHSTTILDASGADDADSELYKSERSLVQKLSYGYRKTDGLDLLATGSGQRKFRKVILTPRGKRLKARIYQYLET